MKKTILIYLFLMAIILLSGSQMMVVAELFTTQFCGPCPVARSALRDINDNPEEFPHFIPIIWAIDGEYRIDESQERQELYELWGPYAQWNGIVTEFSADETTYDAYSTIYNALETNESPLELEIEAVTAGDNVNIKITALLTADIETENNSLAFILTYDLSDIFDSGYFATIREFFSVPFELNAEGETGEYTHHFILEENFELQHYRAVAIVQNMGEEPNIYQGAITNIEQGVDLQADFYTNVTQGPPSLKIQFYDNSSSENGIVYYEWDLNSDGIIDSNEQNPIFYYNDIGSYSVVLTVSDGTYFNTRSYEHIIYVSPSTDVSGEISGFWKNEYSPYIVNDDLFVRSDSQLMIEAGVTIKSNDSNITIEGLIQTVSSSQSEPVSFVSDTGWNGMIIVNSSQNNLLENVYFSNSIDTALTIENSTLTIIGSTFHNNNTNNRPAALAILNSDDIVIKNTIFANNYHRYDDARSYIGTVYSSNSSLEINNSLFVNNGGDFTSILHLTGGSTALLNNITADHNNYLSHLGQHILNDNSELVIENSILRGDGTLISLSNNPITTVSYSNLSGGFAGTGNIDTEPIFVSPSAGSGNIYDGLEAVWYLNDNSPSIDAGNPAMDFNDPENPIFQGFAHFPARGTIRNDMGAYGGQDAAYWLHPLLYPPENLSGELTGMEQVTLNWSYPDSPPYLNREPEALLGFNIYRNSELITPEPIEEYHYIDDNVSEQSYEYFVTAQYNLGESTPSNIITIEFLNADIPIGVIDKTQFIASYPNPFNPATTLSFSISEANLVSILIYNQKGQLVNDLFNDYLSKGTYEVVWNGRNNDNIPVASGLYFAVLKENNSNRDSRKLILLK